MDDRRTWLLIVTLAVVTLAVLGAFLWYLDSTSTSGGVPGEGMIRSVLLLDFWTF